MVFFAKPGMRITIRQNPFRFMHHPSAANMVYAQSARRATVFQLFNEKDKRLYAFKVFNRAYRDAYIETSINQMKDFASLPGMGACKRYIVTSRTDPSLVNAYPEFQYAVLMPWIEGQIWQTFILNNEMVSRGKSKALADSFLAGMVALEKRGAAHCDISGANIMVNKKNFSINFIDLEEMYIPHLTKPQKLPAGTPGYGHKQVQNGIWSPEADRFSGAVLLAEILGWQDVIVRKSKSGESYFDPNEMQLSCERFHILSKSIENYWGSDISTLFTQAWFSKSLSACPTFSDWSLALSNGHQHVTTAQKPTEVKSSPSATSETISIKVDLEKGVQLSSVKSTIQKSLKDGQWGKVLKIGEAILFEFPEEEWLVEAVSISRKMAEADRELHDLSIKAIHSELIEDWEKVIDSAKALSKLQPKAKRYQNIIDNSQARIETIEHFQIAQELFDTGDSSGAWDLLMEEEKPLKCTAALLVKIENQKKIEEEAVQLFDEIVNAVKDENWELVRAKSKRYLSQLEDSNIQKYHDLANDELQKKSTYKKLSDEFEYAFNKKNWKAALVLFDDLQNLQQKEAHRGINRQRIIELINYQEAVEKAKSLSANFAWDEILAILSNIPDDYMNVAYLRNEAQMRLNWRENVERAIHDYDIDAVKRLLHSEAASPAELTHLQGWHKVEIERNRQINKAIEDHNLILLKNLINQLPDNYPNRERILRMYEVEKKQIDAIENAKASFNTNKVKDLALGLSKSHPLIKKYEEWADDLEAILNKIDLLFDLYDFNGIHSLLAELPEKHPKYTSLLQKLNEIESFEKGIREAKEKYDLEKLQSLLEQSSDNFPDKQELAQWLIREQKRAGFIQQSQKEYDHVTVGKLIHDLDSSYPNYDSLQKWIEQEATKREDIVSSITNFDLDKAVKIRRRLSKNHPWFSELDLWISTHKANLKELDGAKNAFDFNQIEQILSQIEFLSLPSIYEPYAKWAETEKTLQSKIRQALVNDNYSQVKASLAELPEGHPLIEEIKVELNNESDETAYLALFADEVQ